MVKQPIEKENFKFKLVIVMRGMGSAKLFLPKAHYTSSTAMTKQGYKTNIKNYLLNEYQE